MRYRYLILLFLFSWQAGLSQINFESLVVEGKTAMNKFEFEVAIKKFRGAQALVEKQSSKWNEIQAYLDSATLKRNKAVQNFVKEIYITDLDEAIYLWDHMQFEEAAKLASDLSSFHVSEDMFHFLGEICFFYLQTSSFDKVELYLKALEDYEYDSHSVPESWEDYFYFKIPTERKVIWESLIKAVSLNKIVLLSKKYYPDWEKLDKNPVIENGDNQSQNNQSYEYFSSKKLITNYQVAIFECQKNIIKKEYQLGEESAMHKKQYKQLYLQWLKKRLNYTVNKHNYINYLKTDIGFFKERLQGKINADSLWNYVPDDSTKSQFFSFIRRPTNHIYFSFENPIKRIPSIKSKDNSYLSEEEKYYRLFVNEGIKARNIPDFELALKKFRDAKAIEISHHQNEIELYIKNTTLKRDHIIDLFYEEIYSKNLQKATKLWNDHEFDKSIGLVNDLTKIHVTDSLSLLIPEMIFFLLQGGNSDQEIEYLFKFVENENYLIPSFWTNSFYINIPDHQILNWNRLIEYISIEKVKEYFEKYYPTWLVDFDFIENENVYKNFTNLLQLSEYKITISQYALFKHFSNLENLEKVIFKYDFNYDSFFSFCYSYWLSDKCKMDGVGFRPPTDIELAKAKAEKRKLQNYKWIKYGNLIGYNEDSQNQVDPNDQYDFYVYRVNRKTDSIFNLPYSFLSNFPTNLPYKTINDYYLIAQASNSILKWSEESINYGSQVAVTNLSSHSRNVLQKPEAYIQPIENVNVDLIETKLVSGKLWFVYGDHAGLRGTTGPGWGAKKKPIEFAEVYCAVEQSGPFIHIVKDKKVNYRGVLSSTAEDYGWIKRSDILLWEYSLVTTEDQGKISRKAIIIDSTNLDNSFIVDTLEINKINFYLDPGMRQPSGKMAERDKVYYIYKIDNVNKSALIGKDFHFGRGWQKSSLAGWVPLNNILIWNNRIALEPNWHSEAAVEREKKGQPIQVFSDKESAHKYKSSGNVNLQQQVWSNDSFKKQREVKLPRLLVLKGRISDGIVKVVVFDELNRGIYKNKSESQTEFFIGDETPKEYNDVLSNKMFQNPGFTAIKLEGHKHVSFKPVLFLNRKELASLIRDIERLAEVPTTSQMRQRLHDTWLELLRSHIGDIDRKEVLEWTMKQVSEAVFEIPTSSGLSSYTLNDLVDPERIDDHAINEFVREVLEKSKELNLIFNSDNYKYSFLSNDQAYYWIEADLLP